MIIALSIVVVGVILYYYLFHVKNARFDKKRDKYDKILMPSDLYKQSLFYTQTTFPIAVYTKTNNYAIRVDFTACVRDAMRSFNDSLGCTMFRERRPFDEFGTCLVIQLHVFQHEGCVPKFDGPGKVLGHSYFPPQKKICIDASEDWNRTKLFLTLLHEIGHALGLNHVQDVRINSIMHPHYNPNLHELSQYDKECLEILYPFIAGG